MAAARSRRLVHARQPEPFRHRHVRLRHGARISEDGGGEIEGFGRFPEGLGQHGLAPRWPLAYLRTMMTTLTLIRIVATIRGRSLMRFIASCSL
jgi:hypothetical protein